MYSVRFCWFKYPSNIVSQGLRFKYDTYCLGTKYWKKKFFFQVCNFWVLGNNWKIWTPKRFLMTWIFQKEYLNKTPTFLLKGTLMQIWKSANIFVFIWKQYIENFTLKHFLLFQIWVREICEKFVYKHSETIEYVKN